MSLDKKNRKGKKVTLVEGFTGSAEELKNLARELKSKCGVGGSVAAREHPDPGRFQGAIVDLLEEKGYKVKRSGG